MELRDRPRGNTLEVQRKQGYYAQRNGHKRLNGRWFVMVICLRSSSQARQEYYLHRCYLCCVPLGYLSRTLLVGLLSH